MEDLGWRLPVAIIVLSMVNGMVNNTSDGPQIAKLDKAGQSKTVFITNSRY